MIALKIDRGPRALTKCIDKCGLIEDYEQPRDWSTQWSAFLNQSAIINAFG